MENYKYQTLEDSEQRVSELQRSRSELDGRICALQHKIVQRRAEIKFAAKKNQFENNLIFLGFEREDAIRANDNTLNVYYQNPEINKLFISYTLGVQDGRTEDMRTKK